MVELASTLSLDEKEVNISVVICQAAWSDMSEHAGSCRHDQSSPSKGVSPASERNWVVVHTVSQCEIDGDIPHVGRRAVENASKLGFLARHTRQLSVSAVVVVGPDEQHDRDDVTGHARHAPKGRILVGMIMEHIS